MTLGIYKRIIGVNSGLVKGKHWKVKDTSNMGHTAWNKGKSMTNYPQSGFRKGKDNYSFDKVGEKHFGWKGDKVCNEVLHQWVRRHKGSPYQCAECGVIGKKIGRNWSIHWSNIDHKYRRVLEDYQPLCAYCHKQYDLQNGLTQQ